MSKKEIQKQVIAAFRAAEEKKATDISLLKLDKSSSGFTDYFMVCSGSNPRQIQTIADEVQDQLEKIGQRVTHIEGYSRRSGCCSITWTSSSTSSTSNRASITTWSGCGSRRRRSALNSCWSAKRSLRQA